MTNRFAAVIWDFDGTLADSLPELLRIYNELAPRYGLRQVEDPDEVRGQSMSQLLGAEQISWWTMVRLTRRLLQMQRQIIGQVKLFDGVAKTIHRLSAIGIRQAVVSSNSRTNLLECLSGHRLTDHFMYIHGTSRLGGKRRAIRRACRKLGVASSDALYVGDEVRDIDAARAASLAIASVTWGLNTKEVLHEHQPDWIVNCPDDIEAICTATS